MEVIVYTRPDCESSRQIKEILENRGVAFQEHVCADGKLDGKEIFWCWKQGEEKIEHWHELKTGYAGRRAIPVTVGGEG